MNNIQKGYLLNLLSVLVMAIGPLLSKFGLLSISPSKAAVINALTIILSSYLLGIITKNAVKLYFEKEVIMLALFNSTGVIFLFISMNLLSPVQIGFLGRFYTVFAVILSVFILGEKMAKREVLFIFLAILGAFMFVDMGTNYRSNLLGSLSALTYTFFFALTNVYIKKTLSEEKSSNSIIFTNNLITLLFVSLYALVVGDLFDGNYSVKGIAYVTASSLLNGFIGTILLYEALKYLRFSIANVTRAFSPLLLAIISFPFFPIELTISNILGGAILLASIILLSLGDTKK